jgi:NADPH:quinone reductase-like Zn-dependent oxidoreductase
MSMKLPDIEATARRPLRFQLKGRQSIFSAIGILFSWHGWRSFSSSHRCVDFPLPAIIFIIDHFVLTFRRYSALQEFVMKAVLLNGYGGVEQLAYGDAPDPKPQSGEVLISVAATSVNPIDWKIRRGDMKNAVPMKFPMILGRDVAGTIAGESDGFQRGDKVMGLVNHSYAELLTAKSDTLARIPDGMEMQDAAALPLVVTTGAQLIEKGVQPRAGGTVLVTGALGGVGRTAVYVAKKHGMKVIAGVRGKDRKQAETLGADRIVAIDDEQGIASLGQVDAIADTVGHDVITKLMPYIRSSGVLASVLGKPQGADGKNFTVREVYAQPDAARLRQLAEAVANGEFSIPIARRMKLSEVREAQRLAEAGGIGKIVLVL